jgi:pimeloyl-ACP methyl ester carboxylesterase
LARLGPRPVAITLGAGGSYDKRYHHAVIGGRAGYSAAEHLAGLGNIVLLHDHLGVGESTRLPQQRKATRQLVALANHAAIARFHARLRTGELHPGLPAIADFARIAGGHSMGGMLAIIQQAEHRTSDGLMVIGYTAEGVHFTMGGQKRRAADFIPDDGPDYTRNERAPLHEGFHWEDVPADVVAADDALAVETPACIGLDSIRTHIVKAEAARIETPVYICLGERDVSPDPHAEPAYYRASRDVTLHILPRSGHCQTFASTRHQMWNRMHHWARGVGA